MKRRIDPYSSRGSRVIVRLGSLITAALVLQGTSAFAITFQLHDHPDGNEAPPQYGFRLDGLLGDSSEEYTFSFDYSDSFVTSDMKLEFDGSTIHIFGTVFGGEDDDSGFYADSAALGIYDIDYTYAVNVSGDLTSGLMVSPEDHAFNVGTITQTHSYDTGTATYTALGAQNVYSLVDEQGSGSYSFKFEYGNPGHRLGSAGWVGWGWVNHSGTPGFPDDHDYSSDWLFTAERVPEAGSTAVLVLLAFGGLGITRRRLS